MFNLHQLLDSSSEKHSSYFGVAYVQNDVVSKLIYFYLRANKLVFGTRVMNVKAWFVYLNLNIPSSDMRPINFSSTWLSITSHENIWVDGANS